jgi:hypothetical protein
VERHDVYFPELLEEAIGTRWRELGLQSVSEYATSVMRYDLLLGGHHLYFRPGDCTREMLPGLDRETLAEFEKNKKRAILADRLLQEAAGRKLTRKECDALLVQVGRKLRALAVEFYL